MLNKTASTKNQNNSRAFSAKSGILSQPSTWPFPPPGGPTGPLKGHRCKKAVVQTQEFDQAPF